MYALVCRISHNDSSVHVHDSFKTDAGHIRSQPSNLPELAGRIRDAAKTVTLTSHKNMWTEPEYIHGMCRALTL